MTIENANIEITAEEFSARLKTQDVFRATITPDVAQEMLETNTNNRSVKIARVMSLAKVIRDGQWSYNAQPITWDDAGKLQNGQHRLMACIEAEMPIDTLLAFGLPPQAVWGVDLGASRSLADHFKMRGEQYPQILTPAIIMLHYHEKGNNYNHGGNNRITPHRAEDLLKRHKEIRHSVALSAGEKPPIPVSSLAFLHYIFAQENKKVATSFIDAITGARTVTADEPVHAFIQFARRVKDKEIFADRHTIITKAIECFTAMKFFAGIAAVAA